MKKSKIRKKILQLRKKNYFKNSLFDSKKILKFLEKLKVQRKIIGGYYPYNYEIDILGILNELEKKNYMLSLPKIRKNVSNKGNV